MTGATGQTLTPSAAWAQRKNLVYLNISLEDVKDPTIKLEKDKLSFKGRGGPEQKEYELTANLFGEINPEESKYVVRARNIEFVLIKANQEEPFWPRLLKDKGKNHWLKIDFARWKDEDDSGDEAAPAGPGGAPGGGDFEEMMRQMGGLGGGGMPGMGGMGGMGGMPGMGGMGMPGMDGMDFDDLEGGEGEGDSDDEELPDLEEAKEDAKA